MRFANAIIIIGAGIGLTGLLEKVTDRPVIVVSPEKQTNDVADLRGIAYPEIIEKQGLSSTLEELTYLVNRSKWVQKFGHPKRKTNKQRCKHNAKLKRR